MPKLNRDQLLSYDAIVPPINLQAKFENVVGELRSVVREAKSSHNEIEQLVVLMTGEAFSGQLTQFWREAHREELETWLREHAEYMPKEATRVSFTEIVPPERPSPARPTRRWLMDQLSEVQSHVYWALGEWKGTLIPSEDLDRFLEEWAIEHLEDAHDQVLRAIEQLVGLGLIAHVSVPNQGGEYVTGYRVLRDVFVNVHWPHFDILIWPHHATVKGSSRGKSLAWRIGWITSPRSR